jgi:hypothetical protein
MIAAVQKTADCRGTAADGVRPHIIRVNPHPGTLE